MIPLYGGTTALCSTLSQEELEATFFYPVAHVDKAPSAAAQAAWDKAKDMCLDCPLMLRCAEEHKGEDFGVWGGIDQFERWTARKKASRRFWHSSAEGQAAEAARVHALHAGHRGLPVQEIALRTGHSVKAVNAMIEAHSALLAEQGEQPAPVAQIVREAATPVWPAGWPPTGDTWVWADGVARTGHVVSVTPDGVWIRVKFRGALRAHVIRYFPAHLVQVRTQTAVPVEEWRGRPDGQARAA